MIPQSVQEQLDVSRETLDRLALLAELLEKWNSKINLVSPSTIKDLWNRHILDSVQLFNLAQPSGGKWLDIGSGGGFPGLVLAIMNAELPAPWDITMMESDVRKCTFLRTVLRETSVKADVVTARIEKADPHSADVLSARALADLDALLSFSERHLEANGTAIFPKGVNWKKEVQAAEKSWSFSSEVIKSETQEGAVILKVRDIKRV
ncbi:16S rRNA (guanine(527)-N(7))-methyltransferase RsmG [Cognatishimia activa]|uniref:16S rRNA (guanine(527)-N(7))-methyltransferase RsmG n=1 Tax=Cognatishimia activa TaxID=1715691 RepID=UPI00222F1F95|nr:16S rRNA (guanine(527)-N(7))-methyltransferase RsmG [Cognatishimia activa]UZD90710.1 16S rRNA (guanine(527)-N(7))-methyltransferase RsmG [Cognatishimia activa]